MEWLKIGEVARRTGLTHRTLRHYDDLGLVSPSGRSGGDYRLYAAEDLERLLAVQHLKSLGLGLEQVRLALDDPDFDAADTLERHIALVEGRLAAEQELLTRLHRLRGAAGAGWDELLDVIALTERLRHPDAWVRFRAALDAPDDAPFETLLDLLRSDPADSVREVATWAVVHQVQAAADAAPWVDRLVAEVADADPGVRRQIAHVLGKVADPRAVPALGRLLEDPDPDVVAKAAFALGQTKGPDALATLAAELGRGSALVRATVVTALGGLGADALDPVVARTADQSAVTRADAAEVLGSLGEPGAVPALGGLVSDPAEDVRVAALMALAAIGGPLASEVIAVAARGPGRTGTLARRLAGSGPASRA